MYTEPVSCDDHGGDLGYGCGGVVGEAPTSKCRSDRFRIKCVAGLIQHLEDLNDPPLVGRMREAA